MNYLEGNFLVVFNIGYENYLLFVFCRNFCGYYIIGLRGKIGLDKLVDS